MYAVYWGTYDAEMNQLAQQWEHVNVFVNEEDIRVLDGEATGVAAGDTVTIVPSIAGG